MQRLTLLAALLVTTICAHATDGVIEIHLAKNGVVSGNNIAHNHGNGIDVDDGTVRGNFVKWRF